MTDNTFIILVQAKYDTHLMAKHRFFKLQEVADITHCKCEITSITGRISGQGDGSDDMSKIKEILENDCTEGYLDRYVWNETNYLHE